MRKLILFGAAPALTSAVASPAAEQPAKAPATSGGTPRWSWTSGSSK